MVAVCGTSTKRTSLWNICVGLQWMSHGSGAGPFDGPSIRWPVRHIAWHAGQRSREWLECAAEAPVEKLCDRWTHSCVVLFEYIYDRMRCRVRRSVTKWSSSVRNCVTVVTTIASRCCSDFAVGHRYKYNSLIVWHIDVLVARQNGVSRGATRVKQLLKHDRRRKLKNEKRCQQQTLNEIHHIYSYQCMALGPMRYFFSLWKFLRYTVKQNTITVITPSVD